MAALSAAARNTIKWRRWEPPFATIAGYVRYCGFADGTWRGDSCGCPDDRCKDGYHHEPDEKCGCLEAMLDEYACSLAGHRWSDEVLERDYGHGLVRWQRCTSCTAANYLQIPSAVVDARA